MAGNLTRFSPFGDMARMSPFRDIEEMMRNFDVPAAWQGEDMPKMIKIDLSETDQDYTVKAEIPGCKKEDIQVSAEGNTVSIRAQTKSEKEEKKEGQVIRSERYYGQQYRSFSLPQEVDDSKVQASYQDGVLKLVLPKKVGGSAKRITIQ